MEEQKELPAAQAVKKKSLLRRILKWTLSIAAGLVLLGLLAVTILVWSLTPERLTPMIEKYASEYLIADVTLDRAELSFWSTFPRLTVKVEDLVIDSRALDSLTPEQMAELPADASKLLRVKEFTGGINALKLLAWKIALYEIVIDQPQVNLVVYDDAVANYMIVPPSEKEDSSAVNVPDISVNKFMLNGDAPVRYFSRPDSMDISLSIKATQVADYGEPAYELSFSGLAGAKLGELKMLEELPITVDGLIDWRHKEPMKLALKEFTLGVGPVYAFFDTAIDFERDLIVNSFDGSIKPFHLSDLIELLPEEYRRELDGLDTNMTLMANMKLTEPYAPAVNPIPAGECTITIPDCRAAYDGLSLDRLAMIVTARLNGDLDGARVELQQLDAEGQGIAASLTGEATSVISDPLVSGKFSGHVDFAKLPQKLLAELPVTVKGVLEGKFDFTARRSWLTEAAFHNIRLNGGVSITDLDITQQELGAHIYSDAIALKLGSHDTIERGEAYCDSLMTAVVNCDSLYAELPGMLLTARKLKMGAGIRNQAPAEHEIIPIGAVLKFDKLNFKAEEDSMRVGLRDVVCRASVRRFEDHARVPLITFDLNAGRLRYGTPEMRVNFRDTEVSASCHPRLRPQMPPRLSMIYDSIQTLHPTLRADSIYKLAQAESAKMRPGRQRGARADSGAEYIDYGLDQDTRNLLRWVDFNGRLTAKRARLFTPYFPVRNSLSDIDMAINMDSLTLRNTRYRMGRSDFIINGTVSNISRSLTSRRQAMRIDLSLVSDTIDVNQIADAAFKGGAYAERVARGEKIELGDSDNDEQMQASVESAASAGESGPILIPSNIDAQLHIRARNIIYSDLLLHDFKGDALVHEGALNLHQLSASTDMGGIALSALYTAPRADDMSFAFGMQIKDLNIEKFVKILPAVDSLMPLLRDIKGVINADVAATSRVDSAMNLVIPSLNAAIKIEGDSLVLLDDDTFKTIAKWLMFKNKGHNMIDRMAVQVVVGNSQVELFPFVFDIDRYKLGVMGTNDLAMNLNYHISVLKSPIPFKFGINIKGSADKMKIRLGRAKFKEGMAVERLALVDTTRINLLNEIEGVFRRGVRNARVGSLRVPRPDHSALNAPEDGDTISAADSLLFIQEGLLPAPPKPEPEP